MGRKDRDDEMKQQRLRKRDDKEQINPKINYTPYYNAIQRLGEPDSPTWKALVKD